MRRGRQPVIRRDPLGLASGNAAVTPHDAALARARRERREALWEFIARTNATEENE
jgi:hypothetical protein